MPPIAPGSLDSIELKFAAGSQELRRFASSATLLGKGGAGAVYSHRQVPEFAIKIYNSTERADGHAAKVLAMIKTPPSSVRTGQGTVQIAWPSAVVLHQGRFIGFAMPRIDFTHAWTLQRVIQPTTRTRHGIPERMDLRLYAALNLASVLQSLHEIGHFVIDMKPQNVLVYRSDSRGSAAHVALVDCDGFQVRGPKGTRYDAELATAEFLHPDVAVRLGGETSFDVKRINELARVQDDFALAIIIFQLLNNGLHPMTCREQGTAVIPTDLASRLHGRGLYYAYASGGNKLVAPDPDSQHPWFDPSLIALFDRAFTGNTQPPAARDWAKALRPITAPQNLCPVSADHWKLGPVCGQCALAKSVPELQATLPKSGTSKNLEPRAAVSTPVKTSPVAKLAPRSRGLTSRLVLPRRWVNLSGLIPYVIGVAVVTIVIRSLVSNQTTPIVPPSPMVSPSTIAYEPISFRDGLQDWRKWTGWFNSLSGEAHVGADYWARERNNKKPGLCYAGQASVSPDFKAGCLQAKAFLDKVDARRKSDADYLRGWNYTVNHGG